MDILVARQPVFDSRDNLYGYDLMLRSRLEEGPSDGSSPPPEQLLADAFLGIGIDRVAEGRCAFVTVDRDMILSEAVRLLPADRVILQLQDPLVDDNALITACQSLVWARYRFAIHTD